MSRFTAVLVETSALEALEYDFMGAHSVALPAFYKLMADKQIPLLDRNVLHQKIKCNIRNSQLIAEVQELNDIYNRLGTLENLGDGVQQAYEVLKSIDLQPMFEERFEHLYANAQKLPDFDVEQAMSCYFANMPPFDRVKKPIDFADALVIYALIEYVKQNPGEKILVVSDNRAWSRILYEVPRVTVENSVEAAIKRFQLGNDFERRVLKHCQRTIEDKIRPLVSDCEFEMDDEDVEVESFDLSADKMTVLQVEDEKVVGRVYASLSNVGFTVRRPCKYDDGDDDWYGDGYASFDCEVEITFDRQELSNTLKVAKVKIVDRGIISLYREYD